MTRRARRAIVNYWLSKRWQGVSPAVMLKLWRRHPRVLLLWLIVSFCTPSLVVAAEKPAQDTLAKKAVKLLTSREGSASKKPLVSPAKKTAAADTAVDPKFKDAKKVTKFIVGTVAYIGKNRMSVEFGSDETGSEEILLTLDPKMKLSGVKKFTDLKYGDKVEVKYRQSYLEPGKKGDEPFVLAMEIIEVKLVEKAEELAKRAALAAAQVSPATAAPAGTVAS